MGVALGFSKIILEGHSLTVIRKCRIDSPDFSEIGHLIMHIKRCNMVFQNVHFRRVNRQANIVADAIARNAL